ncbi:MAG: hypothetical protein MK110_08710 [Fuerstiella sp.]|nr:hypothetical protein [Fuerstiella sp.]
MAAYVECLCARMYSGQIRSGILKLTSGGVPGGMRTATWFVPFVRRMHGLVDD